MTDDRSAELDAAEAQKASAEALAATALADLHRAEQRKTLAEADEAEAKATVANLVREREQEKRRKELAANEHHFVYPFSGEVTSSSVQNCVKQLMTWARTDPNCDMEIIFTSPGGSIPDGMFLFDFIQDLRKANHTITTGTYGMAASMAGILLQAGDIRWMSDMSWVLIHRAAFGVVGQTFDVEDRLKWIKRIEKQIIGIFVSRSGGKITAQKIKRNWERADWWIDSDEALDLGLVDEVRGRMTRE